MLSVDIICIGKLKESYWREAVAEYAKRLSPFCVFSVTELPEERLPDNPAPGDVARGLKAEGERVLARCQRGGLVIPLCVEGDELSSRELAGRISSAAANGTNRIQFIIGGSHGLSDEVKARGGLRLSMSPMTFPHQLARVMLCEQLYRAFSIINGNKYHK